MGSGESTKLNSADPEVRRRLNLTMEEEELRTDALFLLVRKCLPWQGANMRR